MKMRSVMRNIILISVILFSSVNAWSADVPVPVATDSRIKTFVYSENDVFNIVTHYGYESNIEFPANEQIETISIGDRMGWIIVTAGRRLFIRPTLAHARTNMTLVTNKRAYQFDLTAVPAVYSPNEELAYVVRFFYPDDKKNALPQAAYSDEMAPAPPSDAPPAAAGKNNYKYSYTGDEQVAPVKVFDDGAVTYFKFGAGVDSPKISAVGSDKREVPVSARKEGGYWVVDAVSAQFVVRQGSATACIFNEK